ncbi:MAG: hypothetical protein JWL83_591 [Actinomycetia bacterium]|nr:hypothetical protein [Actinomycetes bacterium]
MWVRGVIGLVLLAVGVVWIAQGLGALHGSPMTGQAIWAVLGALLLVVAVALFTGAGRARKRSSHPANSND